MHRALGLLWICAAAAFAAAQRPAVKVFVLAGQSNMEGKAKDELWERQAVAEATRAFFAPFRDRDNERWVVRDDVFVKFLDRRGPLTIGFGSPRCTGCEFAFGVRVGDALQAPVLLIKTAWGGKSIQRDFRPPSAGMPSEQELQQELERAQRGVRRRNEKRGGDEPLPTMADITSRYGVCYRDMIADVRATLADVGALFPALQGRDCELCGFVWFQGWNDMYDGAERHYADNLRHLIDDVRRDLGAPRLPVVIAAMGQNGDEPAKGAMQVVQAAQLAMPRVAGYERDVRAFRTDVLQDAAAAAVFPEWKERPDAWRDVGSDRPYHYLGSAIWFSRIGFQMADEMLQMTEAK